MKPSRRIPSLYADPLSWLVLEAVTDAVTAAGPCLDRDLGHIVVSDVCTLHTMRGLAGAIPNGRMSPLRFSGANPGQICGFAMQLLQLRGPSLVLSMTPSQGRHPAMIVLRNWLRERTAAAVILSLHEWDSDEHRVTSTIFGTTDGSAGT
ncbi:coronafacic acid synthetase component (plasmid) [Azospirillum sp. B510]|nr:coronafacic acid synthetase component [Azospirillum sp. B510]